jgi:hypothetical protein
MLSGQTLYKIAKCRFEEAEILLTSGKPDGAIYLCGYALELILKRHIVKVLRWDGYPDTKKEFEQFKSFKVHDLDVLLRLSGLEKNIQADSAIFAKWQIANTWKSEIRYKEVGSVTIVEARDIINATRDVLNHIVNIT